MDKFDLGFTEVAFGTSGCSIIAILGTVLLNYSLGMWSYAFMIFLPIGCFFAIHGTSLMDQYNMQHLALKNTETKRDNK